MSNAAHNHLDAEQLQAFLDREMPPRALARAEEHLTGCVRCSTELAAWRALLEDLDDLARHVPHEGFADRVMAHIDVPEERPLAARLRERVASVVTDVATNAGADHVPGPLLQDFLEGSVAARRGERIEAHLERCDACAGEADAWLEVMRRLGEAESFAPGEGFRQRVMDGLTISPRHPPLVRLREGIRSLLGAATPEHAAIASPTPEHVPGGLLQDLVDGALPTTAVARIEAHLGDCAHCSRELESWRQVAVGLGALDRFAPAQGFDDRVMRAVGLSRALRAATTPPPVWTRVLDRVRSLVPSSRRAWAALSGVAVTPAVTVGLVAWAVLSHPTITLGSLVSFALWQLGDLASAFLTTVAASATRSAEIFGIYTILESTAAAPAMAVLGVLGYAAVCAVALRILYTNLSTGRPSRGRYAHVSSVS